MGFTEALEKHSKKRKQTVEEWIEAHPASKAIFAALDEDYKARPTAWIWNAMKDEGYPGSVDRVREYRAERHAR